jgi:hypothetical protein
MINNKKNSNISIIFILTIIATLSALLSALLLLNRNELKSEFDSSNKTDTPKSEDNTKQERKYTILKQYSFNHPRYTTVQRDNI